ncbi:ty3-gypsy retrotransposon protein [Cucumis melo var. makuwa]|uniref:Ty3-gypsy retrotransposon protein n=1 Tax=Cucumis melo var. makuwa TaxID=1194695 RepID=A0A5D3DU70_CUCMM|nr:ty3-gypsy retrotransposon protein [Cucumis melo var. makuwa]
MKEGEGSLSKDTEEVTEKNKAIVELSINSVVGLSNPDTTKVKEIVHDREGKGVCESIELLLNKWKVVEDFLPLELGGVDVILGMLWLYSLEMIEVDWKNLTMTFVHQGKKGYLVECIALERGGTLTKGDDIEEVLIVEESLSGHTDMHINRRRNWWKRCWHQGALNSVTISDKFPIAVIEELFDELNGASLFSKIDLKVGYHQIRMCANDIEKMAFNT